MKPNPGSKEARDQGCTCPVLDNSHGKGRYGDGEKYGWWMVADCPIHGGFDAQPKHEHTGVSSQGDAT